jgi:L-malate glycosyltransferase
VRITFLMPCYVWGPSGGFRVVYEYASRLVSRGHQVSVVHPRRLKYPPPERVTARSRIRKIRLRLKELLSTPSVNWHPIDKRVGMLFVPSSDERYLPDADVLFATAWHTVRSVLECPPSKGEKCYLIQGYETWQGPQHLVNDTWCAPLRKVVIARWLLELGKELGCTDISYVPNAIDLQRYRIICPIEDRPQQVVMAFSAVPIKGSADGIKALEIAKRQFPDLKVVLFGISRRPSWIPAWMNYFQNPAQTQIIEELYNRSSIIISPSWTEGFPLPPAEAAACGCAIVATDIGGMQEYVTHGVTGLLSPSKAPEALAENLCLLLRDYQLRIRLAKAANSAISRFDWSHSTNLLEEFIAGGVQRKHRGDLAAALRPHFAHVENIPPVEVN